ncbi:hypothetical protein CP965_06415 [Halarcobacter mediterraneus]|uniref:Ancillary SecYEG translocon subunit/Cell division coordinator CpoB TPR domain-containing protein n=1 Tax=Halarcobacter mediterraneus TaxID=2023153 RepID=A0A4Q1AWI5_9BACT|nr:tetratricopeptide repeat protein [Halarcobacter mediterraneus]RXK13431.1 hypothetical protein CP965_06415 [Halarcobacter mediterraneus]|eukprot:gnl/Chilomastix_cuspidata/9656.p2 GENE.gnl/Chilomastix_cuspidata/9656~~gnl/Chilomastix_cuspidata/9656.p2  ORF type:complete len:194 (+),score=42.13 gnl/Chilomastix_cuspidata/9656:8-589(+)
MSLKDNVDYVKEELSSEEKFLESFVKVERIYKKYKMLIILAVVVILGLAIGLYTTKTIQEKQKKEANIAFNQFLENNQDKDALKTLEENNKQLFQIAKYIQAKKENKTYDIEVKFFKEIAAYQKALDENSIDKLNAVSMEKDFLLKEFAIFNKALLQAKEGKYEDAKATLKLIPEDSQVNDLATSLKHFLVTK